MNRAHVSLVSTGIAIALAAVFAACGDDPSPAATSTPDGGPASAAAPIAPCTVPSRNLGKWDSLPGIALKITDVSGGTGAGGNLVPGDTVAVTFSVTSSEGACAFPVTELDGVSVWLSGPTSNYQHLLPLKTEKKDATFYDASKASRNADGTYTFRFPDPIPATYGPPLWDTTKFADGELTGKPLVDGTYTVAMRAFRKYRSDSLELVDPSTDVKDVLLGAASAIEPREVVTVANCNTCHTTLQRHSGIIRDTRVCVTCHTAGAEDGNSTDTADPTPVTTEFGVMIHKIHAGKHLPSVNGIATNPDGTRKWDAPKARFVVGSGLRDFSAVMFPVAPGNTIPMPRDMGYSTLTSAQQALDDVVRTGPTACDKCHGDPDGTGPLPAPKQGDRAYTNQTRRTCGSCHDDVDWNLPYVANGQTQPPQTNDADCTQCHKATGDAMAVKDSHLHPLENPALNPGLAFSIQSLGEAGTNDANGKLDPGEKIVVSFTIKDDSGADVPASALSGLSMVVSGPTTNRNLLFASTSVPLAALPAGPIYTMKLPEVVTLDLVGTAADDGAIEGFTTARTPHWNVTGALTDVYERTATSGVNSTLARAAAPGQNYVDVASTAGFTRSAYVVLDDGTPGAKEYRQVSLVDGQRLWLNAALRNAHGSGVALQQVTLTKKTAGTAFTVDAAAGTISEVAASSFGAGHDIVATYTTDFVVPAVYPPPANDSPDIDETAGEWSGKSLVPGTYTFGVWGSRVVTANASWGGDATAYKATSPAATKDFLVGSATTLVPYSLVSSGDTCNGCHQDLIYHGGQRRGFDACILCHGNAGAEDRPRYSAANAPATPGRTITFRGLAHEVHMGASLANASTYAVAGYSSTPYPNNFTSFNFGDVVFPVKPGGVQECTKCHGKLNTAWRVPSDRNHPTQQSSPVRSWRATCGSCHDSAAASAHIELQTFQGRESCSVCHGPNGDYAVTLTHQSR